MNWGRFSAQKAANTTTKDIFGQYGILFRKLRDYAQYRDFLTIISGEMDTTSCIFASIRLTIGIKKNRIVCVK
jgi:hypothetical protein